MTLLALVVLATLAQEHTSWASAIQALSVIGGLSGFAAIGALAISWRKSKSEIREIETRSDVSLREIDIEELKSAFPGGVGEIIAHWKTEYTAVVDQLDKTRLELQQLRIQERRTRQRLRDCEVHIDRLEADLRIARQRISQLEAEGEL